MNDLLTFLQSLNKGDIVMFILPNGVITGTVEDYEQSRSYIELSNARVFEKYTTVHITISTSTIIGWGKITPKKD